MKARVINKKGYKINRPALVRWVRRVGKELQCQNSINQHITEKSLLLAFVCEKEMKSLNFKFRKKRGGTDILSFDPVEEGSLGELALCLPVMEKTKPVDFSCQKWLYYLILHGTLHLLGFEHEKGKARAHKMYQLQDTLFEKLYP